MSVSGADLGVVNCVASHPYLFHPQNENNRVRMEKDDCDPEKDEGIDNFR